jgi:murein L,D-transpeptidase YafK
VTYYYCAYIEIDSSRAVRSNIESITIPSKPLPKLTRPSIFIDKVHYFLEIRDNDDQVKRYPVALGQDPFKRKLHQDNATTPEGRYKIINLQPNATFYKAYDINYPNSTDRSRYNSAKRDGLVPSGRAIGGEIQIHGLGIGSNWTWGCVAMRNDDIDELFANKRIRSGVRITIVGYEITRDDLD